MAVFTLWWTNSLRTGKSPFFMGKSTISMDHFPLQTVSSPEGKSGLNQPLQVAESLTAGPARPVLFARSSGKESRAKIKLPRKIHGMRNCWTTKNGSLMIDDDWWWLMIIDDHWWSLILDDCWCLLMMIDYWFLMIIDDDWWLLIIDSWWLLMLIDYWFLMILDAYWWLLIIDSWCFLMLIDDYWLLIHDDYCIIPFVARPTVFKTHRSQWTEKNTAWLPAGWLPEILFSWYPLVMTNIAMERSTHF